MIELRQVCLDVEEWCVFVMPDVGMQSVTVDIETQPHHIVTVTLCRVRNYFPWISFNTLS